MEVGEISDLMEATGGSAVFDISSLATFFISTFYISLEVTGYPGDNNLESSS